MAQISRQSIHALIYLFQRPKHGKYFLFKALFTWTLTFMYGSAFAACDASNGTISVNCTNLLLPQAPAGNANYNVSSGTTVLSNATNYTAQINAPILSFANNGILDGTNSSRYNLWVNSTIINSNLTNNNLITGGERVVQLSTSTISGSLINTGDIITSFSSGYVIRVFGSHINNGIINSATGRIIADGIDAEDAIYIIEGGTPTTYSSITGGIVNTGTISSKGHHAIHIKAQNSVDYIDNQSGGQITTSLAGSYAVDVEGRVDKISNAGIISTNQTATNSHTDSVNSAIKLLATGSIGEIINSGEISVIGSLNASAAIDIQNPASIGSITNTGNIYSVNSYGINNLGSLTTLNNYQGSTGSGGSAISYAGNLPTFYNMIAYGDKYGQLAVDLINHSGSLTYGIYAGDPTNGIAATKLNPHNYINVMSGLNIADVLNANTKVYTFGKHGSLWLRPQANQTTWDLVMESDRISTQFLGYDDPNVVNTYTAMNSNRQATEGILHQRYALLNALMQYDCNRFDKYGVCIQFQTRATGYGTQATGSGILNASYRIADKFRIGAYLDYQAFQGNPFGMYLGSGGVQQNNNNPSFGGYVGYSQNSDETGVQARASGGYNPGQVSVLRAVLAGTEPGYGNAGLNAYYAYGVAGYGVKIGDVLVVTPYGGIQYTDVTRNGYTEQANLLMTIYPLAYNSYYERLVTGLLGAKAKGMLTDKLGYQLSLGAQVDFTRSANSYSGYSYVPGMEIYGIAHGGGWNGVRPAGMAGVFYDPLPNHRVSLNAYTSQQAWTTRTYTTGLLGYQIAF